MTVLEDIIADMITNKKRNPAITRGGRLNNSIDFITQSFFTVLKNIRPNSTHYIIKKIPNTQSLQETAFNHLLDIEFRDFMNFYKKCNLESYSFLVIDTTLTSDNPLRFRNNILKTI